MNLKSIITQKETTDLLSSIPYLSATPLLSSSPFITTEIPRANEQMKMAGFSHVRTSSEPQIPHPVVLKLEQDLHNLKTSLASSPSPNADLLCNALRELADLYKSIDDLLRLPSSQQALRHPQQKKWVEEQLDASVKFLDLVASARDCMALMVEHIQGFRTAAQKRGGIACAVSQKKLPKETRACIKLLKQIDGEHKRGGASSSLARDWDLMMLDMVLIESKEKVIALVRSLLVRRPKVKARRWAFASKDGSEAQYQLELEGSSEGLEQGLGLLFKTLVQNRVCLLNILSM